MQTIGLPTIQDSANQLMWHMSKNHTATTDNFVVVATILDQYNFMSHLATRKVNTFQRGYSMQMVQVLQGHNYVLTKSELDNTIVLYYRGYNVLKDGHGPMDSFEHAHQCGQCFGCQRQPSRESCADSPGTRKP